MSTAGFISATAGISQRFYPAKLMLGFPEKRVVTMLIQRERNVYRGVHSAADLVYRALHLRFGVG